MSRRRRTRQHLGKLEEIGEIMQAMKNLALLETHKLTVVLENQRVLLADLEGVAADFLSMYPRLQPAAGQGPALWLLFGSERGFCGDFNEALLAAFDGQLPAGTAPPGLIAVGRKLHARLQDDPRVLARVDGAEAAEETADVLTRLIAHIGKWQERRPGLEVKAFYYRGESGEPAAVRLLPPFARPDSTAAAAIPPLVQVPPRDFYLDLVDRYLFVALQEIAGMSLMAEAHSRIRHMSGALNRLEEKRGDLLRRYHEQRQEDITEEIEIILLNAGQES